MLKQPKIAENFRTGCLSKNGLLKIYASRCVLQRSHNNISISSEPLKTIHDSPPLNFEVTLRIIRVCVGGQIPGADGDADGSGKITVGEIVGGGISLNGLQQIVLIGMIGIQAVTAAHISLRSGKAVHGVVALLGIKNGQQCRNLFSTMIPKESSEKQIPALHLISSNTRTSAWSIIISPALLPPRSINTVWKYWHTLIIPAIT